MTAETSVPYTEPLRSAVVEITNRCNLRCPHCASTSGRARPYEMSVEAFADLFAHMKALGAKLVTIIGGEALLREDWFEICSAVKDAGMGLSMVSNGLLIDDAAIGKLAELSLEVVGISLDGATRETYRKMRGVDRFEQIYALLFRLQEKLSSQVSAVTTFSRDNLHEFDALADLMEDTGITWQVQIAHTAGERFAADRFFSSLFNKICG